MIYNISIKDFAIIKNLNVELQDGLNIITGETGAGKSIVIEAVSMALGARADKDCIRTGADKAVISIAADSEDPQVISLLDDMGVPSDMPVIISREISPQRSICRVNGTMVPLSSLSKLCRNIADIHGQYDHQYLLSTENHIKVLDLYGGVDIAAAKASVSASFLNYQKLSSELRSLKNKISDSERQKELLSYELNEIESADISDAEDEKLSEEISLMKNSELIYASLESAYSDLFGSDSSASSSLGGAMNTLQQIQDLSAPLSQLSETVADCFYRIEDIQSQLRRLKDSIEYSEEELDEKTERLAYIDTLKRKYGGSIESIHAYAEKARNSLSVIENADSRLSELENQITNAKADYVSSARKLTQFRNGAARRMEAAVSDELSQLAFANSIFKVSIEQSMPSENGSDCVEFLISTNKGEEPRPLEKTVSGGELSRIMLALKRIIGDTDSIPTMIFDEVDTGISGATAGVVGRKLSQIAENHQIICITHLPQIACFGSSHFRIQKTSDDLSTQTTVVPLDSNERIEELARLLSGTDITDAARQQAKELLKSNSAYGS